MPAYSFSFTTGPREAFVSLAVPGPIGTYSSSVEPVFVLPLVEPELGGIPALPPHAVRSRRHPRVEWHPKLRQGLDARLQSDPKLDRAINGVKDEVVIGSTSLSGGGPLPKGDYLVRANEGGWNLDLPFSVVDTAIVTKVSNDELLAWVLDLDSGRVLLPGVKVTARGEIAGANEAVTDNSGIASFALPSIAGEWPPKGYRQYTVRIDDGGRQGVGSTYGNGTDRLSSTSRLNTTPVCTLGTSTLSGQFTAPAKRSSSTRWSGPTTTQPTPCQPGRHRSTLSLLTRSRRSYFASARPSTNSERSAVRSNSPTARPSASTESSSTPIPGSQPRSDSFAASSFTVAEFRKPEFQVAVETDKQAYTNGESIQAKTTATFFFGGTLEGAAVEWSAMAVPFRLNVKGYERFSFSDYDYYRTSVVREAVRAQGSTTTGAGGSAAFAVPAVLKGDEGAMQFTVSATVTNPTARAVASSTNVTVHPADLYAGIKPADYLGESGKEARIDLVTTDTVGKSFRTSPSV